MHWSSRTEIDDTSISIFDGQSTPRKRAIDNTGKAFQWCGGGCICYSTDDVVRITLDRVGIFEDSNNFEL